MSSGESDDLTIERLLKSSKKTRNSIYSSDSSKSVKENKDFTDDDFNTLNANCVIARKRENDSSDSSTNNNIANGDECQSKTYRYHKKRKIDFSTVVTVGNHSSKRTNKTERQQIGAFLRGKNDITADFCAESIGAFEAVNQPKQNLHQSKNDKKEKSSANSDFTADFFEEVSKADKREARHKRGPKSSVPVKQLHLEFNKFAHKIVKDNVLVKPSESRIYRKIASRFDNYQAPAVYQAAKRYFQKRISNLKLKTTHKNECDDYMSTYDRYKLKPQQYTKFSVNIEELPFFRNENGHTNPTEEWAPIFRKIVFAMSRAPCAWSISRPRMAGNEITVNGHCLQDQCEAKLFAFTENNHARLMIHVTPANQSIKHAKKNQIRGSERDQILNQLKDHKPMVVVAKIAQETLRIGDVEPPFLPNIDTVRKINSKKIDHLIFDDDPLLSLRAMKYTEPYQNSIGNIGMDPFDCFFGTPYQRELLRIETNRRKIILSFDASGVPIKIPKTSSYSLAHGKFKPIYQYVIMLQGETGRNVPVYQFLSQRQDATNIRLLLDTWKEQNLGKKHPDEVITDAGAALVLATVKAFTNCYTMLEYDDMCYDALFSGEKRPATYIRLDRAHTIQSMLGMLKDLDRNKKRFYSRLLGVLLLCENIDTAKIIIENMLVVLLNRYQYSELVINAIKFLKELADTHIFPNEMMNDDEKSMDNVKLPEDDRKNIMKKKQKTNFFNWVNTILEEVKMYEVNIDLNNSDEQPFPDMDVNPYYAEKLEKDLTVFLSKIHLWSNVMMDCLGSTNKTPTTACSEGHFNIVKNVIFANEKKLRVDIYVRRYIDVLEGCSIKSIIQINTNDMKLRHESGNVESSTNNVIASDSHWSKRTKNTERQLTDIFLPKRNDFAEDFCTEQHQTHDSIPNDLVYSLSTDENDDSCGVRDNIFEHGGIDEPQENWKNQNLDIKPNASSRRCKTTILEPTKNLTKLRVFMNANLWIKKKKSSPQMTHNTCTFDAIFQLYAACYLDSAIFKALAEKNTSSNFMMLVKSFCQWDDMEKLLASREKLLYETFDDKVIINRRIMELDCYMSIIDMFIGIANRNVALYSLVEEIHCSSCASHFQKIRYNIPVMCLDLDLTNVSRSIKFRDLKKCEHCDVDMDLETTRRFSPVVVVDLDGMQNPKISIEKIENILELDNKNYHLRGLIETTGNHFIAHALRPDGQWYSYDDLRPTETKKIKVQKILHPVFLLYCLFDGKTSEK